MLEPKTNSDGLTTAEAATLEAASGFEVWRMWSGPGGLREEMEGLRVEHDDLTELLTVGRSLQGQPIYAMRVTADADRVRRGSRPAVLYNAAQHAREWITPEVNRRLLRHMLEGYGTDDRITDILDTTELWFVLVANPDGYDHTFTEGNRLWRKNLRDTNSDGELTAGEGVDLNRNFATNWGYDNEGSTDVITGETYRGTGPASEPETQAMERLLGAADFSFMVNYHSAAELILYGVGWQVDDPTPDDLVNIALAGDDANPAIDGYDPDLSAELYVTNGETTDHAGAVYDILGFTPELATCQTATTYLPDDPYPNDYCQIEGRSGFEFPDSEELVQFEFEKNIEFALAIAESAADPADPVSPVGTPAPEFWVDEFDTSHGSSQEVAVWAKREYRQLRLNYRINDGAARSKRVSEWEGGEIYGGDNDVYYVESRGTVTGTSQGDQVEVWFTARTSDRPGEPPRTTVESDHFTYEVVNADADDVLIVVDNSPGTPLGGLAPLEHVGYYTDALEANGYSWEIYDVGVEGPVPHPLGVLGHYPAVVWYDGEKLVTDYQGGLETTLLAHQMNIVMRDYINEGGKVLATGKNHGFEEFFPLNYGENGAPEQVCTDVCLVLSDDVYQYWFGAFTRSRRGGLASDGSALDVAGTADPFTGYNFGLDGGTSADNQGAPGAVSTGTASWVLTSSLLPPDEFPQFASTRAATWDVDGGLPFEPVTGDWQMATAHDDVSYKRLARTIDMTAATTGSLSFKASYSVEANWDFVFVEARPVGTDDWTTLPDANGNTDTAPGDSCTSGWGDELHPQLHHYQTLNPDGTCSPTGTTGAWHAATGASNGVETWNIDLSAYAGQQVEVAITYATDWFTGDLGLFLDDTTVTLNGAVAAETSFEDGLGGWTVPGAPEGSAPNAHDWERVGLVVQVASIIATDDTLLYGFGFEGVETEAQRNEVMARSMVHLIGAP